MFFRVNGNKEIAEDLVSEIFLKALEHFADYDSNKSKSAWIMTIARNHLANHWRDKKETVALVTDEQINERGEVVMETAAIWSSWQTNEFAGMPQTEAAQELDILLRKLNDIEREIVTSHYLFGYNYLEIGQALAMTETAVKVAAHRAVKKMRKV